MSSSKLSNLRRVLRALMLSLVNPRSQHQLPRQFVFIHIPKTGGTSFLMMLLDSMHPHAVYPNALEYFFDLKGDEATITHKLLGEHRSGLVKQRDWFVAHLDYQTASTLVADPLLFTFLRDPADRVVSEIVHLKCRHEAFKDLPLEEIIEKRAPIAGALQAHRFGYRPRRKNLGEAVENLHKCDFIGFTDRMSASIASFNQLFGTSFPTNIRVNVGDPELKEEVEEKYIEQIEELIAIDRAFYQSAPILDDMLP